jgi:ABC-type multidrug transport system ATPase subunit
MVSIVNLEKKQGFFSLRIERMHIGAPGIYGIIGPNGCGKTTAAKLISGVLPLDSGVIDIALGQREITMVSQKPYMMDNTVYNNLVYPLRLRGITPDASLCDEWLAKIGFAERRNQRARSLSAGERQKLALLRAFIFNPRLIILDEAMTDLDIDSLDMFEAMVLERQRRAPVVWIIISHQLAHIRRLCDYIFFMAAGRLEAEGPAEELLSSANPLVRRYLKHEIVETAGKT